MFLRRLLLTSVAGLTTCIGVANAGAEVASCDQAAVTIGSYYDAIGTGDVSNMHNLTAGTLAEQQRLQSDNPGYPGYLVERYEGVEYKIMSCVRATESIVEADVLESLSWNEHVQKKFQLQFFNEDSIMHIINISLSVAAP